VSVLLASKLRFFDTTLRDGEQTPGVSLNPNEKLEIATRLADLGVDVVEAGSAAASTGEQDAIRLISSAGLPIETCTFVRAVNADIDYAADNGADSVHLVIPVSDLHIEKKLRKTREQVKEMAWRSVEYAKSRGLIVELSGEDASRADQAFLAEVYARRGGTRGRPALLLRYGRGAHHPRSVRASSRRLQRSLHSPSTATMISALRSQTRSRP
jgi:(R)-citramalate synthase (EC 2.3.3.-)